MPSRPVTLGLSSSFGFGDQIGLATPGHVEAMQRAGGGIEPIFAQQSIREMTRTRRTPEAVMQDALRGMDEAGWSGQSGADADRLTSLDDVAATVAAGFTYFTIDPSARIDPHAEGYDEGALRARYAGTPPEARFVNEYRGTTVTLATGTRVDFTERTCLRAAVKYGRAIKAALDLAHHVRDAHERVFRDYEIELSVHESEHPTTLAEHYIIADQCLKAGMKLVSFAPRLIGALEAGVEYQGDLAALERSLRDHAAIAELLGPYKLSLHSGSDKLSMYPALARATRGRFHVKTAGTSYLEALRVAARHDADLFRRIIDFARGRYETDRATAHVSARLDSAPLPSEVRAAADLERLYLGTWSEVPAGRGFTAPARQVLHCTSGSVLAHEELGPALRSILEQHAGTYREVLAEHLTRHLEALRAGM